MNVTRFSVRLGLIFTELDRRVTALNLERAEFSGIKIGRSEIRVLGQMSLLTNDWVSHQIVLAETGDLDAHVRADRIVEMELRAILIKNGLVYDESSNEIWIAPQSKFEMLFELSNLTILRLDPESCLVSKAIKAKEKNKILIQEALSSGAFPTLAARIEMNGGSLDYFLE